MTHALAGILLVLAGLAGLLILVVVVAPWGAMTLAVTALIALAVAGASIGATL